jgi:hypothetical protein
MGLLIKPNTHPPTAAQNAMKAAVVRYTNAGPSYRETPCKAAKTLAIE